MQWMQQGFGNDWGFYVAYDMIRLTATFKNLKGAKVSLSQRYTSIEKLCLSLYYACTKLRHYLLSSTCIVVCQTDVIKHMLQNPILSGRIGKWAYALVEYDLACEPLKSMKGQIVADFIVEHRINDKYDLEVGYITCTP